MTADSDPEVRAELNAWVEHLNETITILYSEIGRIRRGGLVMKGEGTDGTTDEADRDC